MLKQKILEYVQDAREAATTNNLQFQVGLGTRKLLKCVKEQSKLVVKV